MRPPSVGKPRPLEDDGPEPTGPPTTHREGDPVAGWWADARAAAVAEVLAPFAWRDFTDRMLARRVVGAVDRYVVLRFVSTIPGAKAGGVGPVEPAEPGDARVDHLVRLLETRQWRGLSLDRLCADLITALAAWQADWESASGPGGAVEDR